MVKEFTQWPEFIIEDVETLKALADVRRIRILELLVRAPHTAKELAAKLEMQPSKIYYHINLLEKYELIQVVDTRLVSGIMEKTYQSVAKSYHPSRNLISNSEAELDEQIESLVLAMLDQARADIITSFSSGVAHMQPNGEAHKRLFTWNALKFLTAEEHEMFMEDLVNLFHKYERDKPTDETQTYRFYLTAFPIADDMVPSTEMKHDD